MEPTEPEKLKKLETWEWERSLLARAVNEEPAEPGLSPVRRHYLIVDALATQARKELEGR